MKMKKWKLNMDFNLNDIADVRIDDENESIDVYVCDISIDGKYILLIRYSNYLFHNI